MHMLRYTDCEDQSLTITKGDEQCLKDGCAFKMAVIGQGLSAYVIKSVDAVRTAFMKSLNFKYFSSTQKKILP